MYIKSIIPVRLVIILSTFLLGHLRAQDPPATGTPYEHPETRELVALVTAAADLVRTEGEPAFDSLRASGSRWRQGETYVFVLNPQGKMLVHPDPELEGHDALDLKDVNGKPITRGLLAAANSGGAEGGWYHYQWPVPDGLLPRWKSTYLLRVTAPSGRDYIVGSGMYNDRMERPFVVDLVKRAVREIEQRGPAAFDQFRDPTGPFLVKDTYVFVIDTDGTDLVNPAFPNLEGRNLLDVKDTAGKAMVREMFSVIQSQGSGWVTYLWPKPGDSVSTEKSAFVSRAKLGDRNLLVGAGVYLSDAPHAPPTRHVMSAQELKTLVREGAALLQEKGADAYPEFRRKGSKWFQDDTYLFVWALDGMRVFHATEPEGEGQNVSGLKDIVGRPIGKMFIEAAQSPSGEGWVHYMYPQPGDLFPTWKSTFIKRVTYPSGMSYLVGAGLYNMQMDESFIEDLVQRASTLIEQQGADAFSRLRDKTGPFVFMDTYVFVLSPEGTELVNPAYPSLEGKNLLDLKDLQGNPIVKDEIAAATQQGSTWLEQSWYKPGENRPARKRTFVRRVSHGDQTYIVGSGFYPTD